MLRTGACGQLFLERGELFKIRLLQYVPAIGVHNLHAQSTPYIETGRAPEKMGQANNEGSDASLQP
jgi:hypothetical protein